jgi:GntR family transcriptional regulator, transcriptional repressor for pyruvate dehydrogenase complex
MSDAQARAAAKAAITNRGPDPAQPGLAVSRIRPAYQQVADQLREFIVNGTLSPGDRLPVEAELASVFGVSRSTIREALRLLSSRGLIYTVRGVTGGTFVGDADRGTISDFLETSIGLLSGNQGITADELLEARDVLEVPAARLAAQRRSGEHLEAMRAAIAQEKAETERGLRFEHHQRFHSVLLEAAGNRLLGLMTEPIFRVIRSRFLQDQPGRKFWTQVDDDHTEILRCVEAGDADRAAEQMHAHLGRLRSMYAKVGRQ